MLRRLTCTALAATLLWSAAARGSSPLVGQLRREVGLLQQLVPLSSQAVAISETLSDLSHEARQLGYEIEETRRRSTALASRLRQRHQLIRQRVRSLYKLSRGGLVRLVLDGAAGGEMMRRLTAARLILARDARELELFQQETQRLAKQQQQLERALRRSAELSRQLRQQRGALQHSRDARNATLSRLRWLRRQRQDERAPDGPAARHLLRRIAQLRHRVRTAGGFAARKGQLRWPVRARVVGTFGALRLSSPAELKRIQIMRRGLTLRPARQGTRIVAVAAGTVQLAQELPGMGQVVLLEHSDGYRTLYGFLQRLEVKAGQRLKAGDAVGRCGSDPLTGQPALYFELRRQERALDPRPWLRR